MKRRYVYDREHDRMVEVTERRVVEAAAPLIMPDIKPYRSMVTGEVINSRSRHREHLRDHGCIEVGNDSSLHQQPRPIKPPPGRKELLIGLADKILRRR